MKTHHTLLLLLALMTLSFCLRVIPPYDQVFTGEWIKFTSYDAYWQMARVDKIAPDFPYSISQFSALEFQAIRTSGLSFFNWLLAGTIWAIGLGSPTQHTIDTVGVYFPAVLGALTVIPVYFLGKVMFGRLAGAMAALLIAVLPGEFLGRSSLGFTDHHVLEVLLTTTALLFLVMAIKGREK